jgi:Flp pilus assembly protein TadB
MEYIATAYIVVLWASVTFIALTFVIFILALLLWKRDRPKKVKREEGKAGL